MALGNGSKRDLEGKSADCKQFNLGEIQYVWISTFHLVRGASDRIAACWDQVGRACFRHGQCSLDCNLPFI
jgi:hypothetical protein